MKKHIYMLAFYFVLACGTEGPPLATVKQVDLSKYGGTWYEIARLPNSFEKGLVCVSATYRVKADGYVEVVNRGRPESDTSREKDIKGMARVPDPLEPGRLEVSFFRPFWGDYRIIDLDPDYRYALVGTINRRYLWILAREPAIDETVYSRLVSRGRETGFNVDMLYRTPQKCYDVKR